MDNVAISVDKVSKRFKIPHERYTSLKQSAIHLFSKRQYTTLDAVNDVSLEVKKGEFFGILGRNGSGKSTLLKMLAGIYQPTSGKIIINGTLSPFIELGVGFNPELTARENVYLNGAILGLSRKQVAEKFDEIIGFGELEEFVDQKLKNFSSGMQVRLAFSIAIQAHSDILLVDEVLAVGDANFQSKCFDVFRQLKKEGKTIVFVTHDMGTVREFCDRVALIDNGSLVVIDTAERSIHHYNDLNVAHQEEKAEDQGSLQKKNRWGSGEAHVTGVLTKADKNRSKVIFSDRDEEIVVEVEYQAKKSIVSPVYGIIITRDDDQIMFTSNTLMKKLETKNLKPGQKTKVEWRIPNVFNSGTFLVAPAVANQDGKIIFDWIEAAHKFKVQKIDRGPAFINAEHRILVDNQNR